MASSHLHSFELLSSALTGFSVFELRGTGLISTYFGLFRERVGSEVFERLLGQFDQIRAEIGGSCSSSFEARIRREILADDEFGVPARHLIKLWYLGSWDQISDSWWNVYASDGTNVGGIPNASAYIEGLAWKAMHSHPMAAKPPGFASWEHPPTSTVNSSNKKDEP